MRNWPLGLVLATLAMSAGAQEQQGEEEIDPVWQAVVDTHVAGPAQVELRDEATIEIDEDVIYIPRPAADGLMNAMGNVVNDEFIGLLWPKGEPSWFVTVDYIDSGHIDDEEARDWDVDGLLEGLREGTRASNEWRESRGFAPIEVTGWVEPPRYDAAMRQLVWSAGVKDVGAPTSDVDSVNYNTYVLGREGYLSLNLITSVTAVENDKTVVHGFLQATRFNEGRGYDDFDVSTDRVAAYGIAALVGGIAAKKLGLIAVAVAFLIKGWKIALIAFVGLGAAARRFMGRKSA